MTSGAQPSLGGSLVRMMAPELPLILSLIFGGCCSNVFALEVIVKDVPKSGHLVTFGQFIFVALEGLRYQVEWPSGAGLPRLKPTVVPLSRWAIIVTLFFIVSTLNNLALGYRISMPLHIIFRSGGLFANMVMGALILRKRYPLSQVVGVGLVTLGVIWSTLDNASPTSSSSSDASSSTSDFLTGIAILVVAMILSAGMGLLQEVTYKKYGKQWREGLFYTHFLALPFFLFFYNDLLDSAAMYSASPLTPLSTVFERVPVLGSAVTSMLPSFLHTFEVPKLWAFLVLNVLTQYVCITGVNRMTASASSLTLNLVLNLRKFTSLLISIVYFDNEFGMGARFGTGLVIVGTIIYTQSGISRNRTSVTTTTNNNHVKKT